MTSTPTKPTVAFAHLGLREESGWTPNTWWGLLAEAGYGRQHPMNEMPPLWW